MPNTEIKPGALTPVIHTTPLGQDAPDESSATQGEIAGVSMTRAHIPDGAPKLQLGPSDANFLRSPRGALAPTLISPFQTPAESMRLALASRALHEEITGEPDVRVSHRYAQLRSNYVQQRQLLGMTNVVIADVVALSKMGEFGPRQIQIRSNANAFLALRAEHMKQCVAIAAECQGPGYPLLAKLDHLFTNWETVTSRDLLAFEEELLEFVDNTAQFPGMAYALHGKIYRLKNLERQDSHNYIGELRDQLRVEVDDARERLLDLTFQHWHSAKDAVRPSRPPENRVRFFHHPPATDWTADKMLEQPADVDSATGLLQTNPQGEAWTQSVAWPRPSEGVTRHRFVFYNPFAEVMPYSCVHVFNSTPASLNMEQPD